MIEFYEFFQISTDEEMATRLKMDVLDLKRHLSAGRTPWPHLIPALVEAGVTVEVCMGNMEMGIVRNPNRPPHGPTLRVRARVDYNQLMELRRNGTLK